MKIAYLVLAHHQPKLLARLLDRILDEDAHVFVHIDGRSAMAPFRRALEAGIKSPFGVSNLHFAPRRRKVSYFGYSTVAATLSLMKQASDSESFKYYTLLSGADYPIKDNSTIKAFFRRSDLEFISYWKLDDRPSWQHKIQHYFLTDYVPIRGLRKPSFRRFWRVDEIARYLYWRTFERHRDRFPKRAYPLGDILPYGGSQWWSLSDPCVRFILRYVEDHPEVVRFFRFTQCPDELFFQTIVMNSVFATRAVNFEEYRTWSAETASEDRRDEAMLPESSFNYRYIDWSGPYGGGRGYPYVLDERDFDALRESRCLFARKFDEVNSARLLDRIDSELLGIAVSRSAGTASSF